MDTSQWSVIQKKVKMIAGKTFKPAGIGGRAKFGGEIRVRIWTEA